jgi:hypothetical protein
MRDAFERWLDYARMKWSIFRYNFGWSDYVFLFDGWVSKCAMAVPILGYLILFNDSVSQHLSFDRLADESLRGFGLSANARLKLIYFGMIFLGSASILYLRRRPFVFSIGTNQFDYVEKALKHFTVSAYIDIAHDSMGWPRYVGRGNVFRRLDRIWRIHRAELCFFSIYTIESKKHAREIETLLIRAGGSLLSFNTRKKRHDTATGWISDYEAGTAFAQRMSTKGNPITIGTS